MEAKYPNEDAHSREDALEARERRAEVNTMLAIEEAKKADEIQERAASMQNLIVRQADELDRLHKLIKRQFWEEAQALDAVPQVIPDEFISSLYCTGGQVADQPKPMQFLWGEYLPEDRLSILAAAGGTGKSIFAKALAFHVALGWDFLDIPTRKANVLYLDFEEDRDMFVRHGTAIANAMGLEGKIPGNVFYSDVYRFNPSLEVPYLSRPSTGPLLRAIVEQMDIGLIIIDSLTIAARMDIIDQYQVIDVLSDTLVSLPCGILALDHVTKANQNNESADPFGSVFKRNLARSVMTLTSEKTIAGKFFTLTQGKAQYSAGADAFKYQMWFSFDPKGKLPGREKYNKINFEPVCFEPDLVARIRQLGGEDITAKEVRQNMIDEGAENTITVRSVKDRLNRLVSKKALKQGKKAGKENTYSIP